jgi:hypothetical protein
VRHAYHSPAPFVFSDESVDVGADQDASLGQRVGHALDRQPGAVVVDEVDRMAKLFVEREVTEFARRTRAVEVIGPAEVRDAPDMDALALVAREPAGLRDRAGQGGDHEGRGSQLLSEPSIRTSRSGRSLIIDHESRGSQLLSEPSIRTSRSGRSLIILPNEPSSDGFTDTPCHGRPDRDAATACPAA